ncbi:hypothetical protein SISSUDRAFT_1055836 [Sistotremastrum suecicum HHB10207 ss-3]|uniref:Uncharacterized protein n=1 Tax=Sistotremastrum suecicum HHB10207 ss-3 TaxID=1314776 RepID=A0A165XHW9_9AGAM|nr:hypothetical protein SISSUDRAFT_1055836 [Sistotremastrum suecicum HHB10207 ss-3]
MARKRTAKLPDGGWSLTSVLAPSAQRFHRLAAIWQVAGFLLQGYTGLTFFRFMKSIMPLLDCTQKHFRQKLLECRFRARVKTDFKNPYQLGIVQNSTFSNFPVWATYFSGHYLHSRRRVWTLRWRVWRHQQHSCYLGNSTVLKYLRCLSA